MKKRTIATILVLSVLLVVFSIAHAKAYSFSDFIDDLNDILVRTNTGIDDILANRNEEVHELLGQQNTEIHTILANRNTEIDERLTFVDPDISNEIMEILANNNNEVHVILAQKNTEIHAILGLQNTEIHEILSNQNNEIHELLGAGIQVGVDETLGIIQKQIHTTLSKVADVSVIHPLVAREEVDQLVGNYDLLEETLSAGESRTAVFIFLDSCYSGGFISEVKVIGYEDTIYSIDPPDWDATATLPELPPVISREELDDLLDQAIEDPGIKEVGARIIIAKKKPGRVKGKRPPRFDAFPVRYDVVNVDSSSGLSTLREVVEVLIDHIEYK